MVFLFFFSFFLGRYDKFFFDVYLDSELIIEKYDIEIAYISPTVNV